MNYPVVIHKDKCSDYGVTVPDLPGCFSAGPTLDEAIEMAREAIELHLEGLIEAGESIPQARTLETHRANRDFAGGTWAVVSVAPDSLRIRAKRVNVTIPERVLHAMDRFAGRHGDTRSSLIVQAVTTYMGRSRDKAMRPAKRGRPRRRAATLAKKR